MMPSQPTELAATALCMFDALGNGCMRINRLRIHAHERGRDIYMDSIADKIKHLVGCCLLGLQR